MSLNYRERLNAGLYSPDEDVRVKAERSLARRLQARLKAEAGEVEEAEVVNEQRVEQADKA